MKFSGEVVVGARRDAVFAKLHDIYYFASRIVCLRDLTPLRHDIDAALTGKPMLKSETKNMEKSLQKICARVSTRRHCRGLHDCV